MKGQPRQSEEDLGQNGQVGDWFIPEDGSSIFIKMPNPAKTVAEWPFKEPLENGSCWEWDGNRAAPTVTPSLHWVNVWHGWMRAGELVEA